MKKVPILFRSTSPIPVKFPKNPEQMTRSELLSELTERVARENMYRYGLEEKERLIHELEVHQLELEIQNREVEESYGEVRELNQKYFDLYEFAPVGYVTLDEKGKVLEMNLTAAVMLGQERKEIVYRSFLRWVSPVFSFSFMEHISECDKSRSDHVIREIELKKNDGTSFYVELHSIMATDPINRKPVIRMAMIDVSERQRALEAEAATQTLREEKDLRESYISTISHDLRTPLTSSKLCAQMLRGEINDPEKKDRLFHLMVEELDRADRMIKELLDASRLKNKDKLPLVVRKCDLGKIAKNCVESIQMLTEGKVKIVLRVTGKVTGMWSKDGLHRIIENLVSNAVKYGARDFPVTVAVEGCDDMVTIIVHNHGDPIPLKDRDRIFKAFHRADSAARSDFPGWGLGLSLVQNIVHRHEGTIDLQSNASEGTSFVIQLPKIGDPR